MNFRKLATLTASTLCVLALASSAPAQRAGGYRPPVVYYRVPAPAPVAPQTHGDGPGVFLSLLNLERARQGRGPLAWSHRLAAFAALNDATHAPGSSGGGSQCWAGCSSYTQAFQMWRGSAAHWAILMNATTEVGVAPCATGLTCNAR